jgi:hypothetical protein
MKKILYICTENQDDWETLIPHHASSPSEFDISVLLLQHAKDSKNIPVSQVYSLETGEEAPNNPGSESISYQDFLEKIFLSDLTLVL